MLVPRTACFYFLRRTICMIDTVADTAAAAELRMVATSIVISTVIRPWPALTKGNRGGPGERRVF